MADAFKKILKKHVKGEYGEWRLVELASGRWSAVWYAFLHEDTEDAFIYLYINCKKELIMLAIRLPAEVENRLDALAQATGRTKTFYAREAILEHLDDLEDLYLAEKRLIEIPV